MAGLDRTGTPLVLAATSRVKELWRLATANPCAPVTSGPFDELGPGSPSAADAGGVWLSGFLPSPPYAAAIYRWTEAGGLQLGTRFTDRQVMVAGTCT